MAGVDRGGTLFLDLALKEFTDLQQPPTLRISVLGSSEAPQKQRAMWNGTNGIGRDTRCIFFMFIWLSRTLSTAFIPTVFTLCLFSRTFSFVRCKESMIMLVHTLTPLHLRNSPSFLSLFSLRQFFSAQMRPLRYLSPVDQLCGIVRHDS